VEGAGLEGLLPVPWVFAWSQTRYMLPGWYGAGSALRPRSASWAGPTARCCDGWFFSCANLLDDVETMRRARIRRFARYYDELVPEPLRRFSARSAASFDSCLRADPRRPRNRALLDSDPTLSARSSCAIPT